MDSAFIKNRGQGGNPPPPPPVCYGTPTHSAGCEGQWGGWCSSLGHTRTLDPCSPDSAPAEVKGTPRCPGNQKNPDNRGQSKPWYGIGVQQKLLNVSCVPCRWARFPQKRCSCSCTCLNGCRERWGAGRSSTLKDEGKKYIIYQARRREND